MFYLSTYFEFAFIKFIGHKLKKFTRSNYFIVIKLKE